MAIMVMASVGNSLSKDYARERRYKDSFACGKNLCFRLMYRITFRISSFLVRAHVTLIIAIIDLIIDRKNP